MNKRKYILSCFCLYFLIALNANVYGEKLAYKSDVSCCHSVQNKKILNNTYY